MGRALAIQPKSSNVAPGSRVATSRVRLLSLHRLHSPILFLTSRAVLWLALHALSSGGEAGQERRCHDGDSDYVVAAFKILIFRSHVLKMSTAVPSGPKKK